MGNELFIHSFLLQFYHLNSLLDPITLTRAHISSRCRQTKKSYHGAGILSGVYCMKLIHVGAQCHLQFDSCTTYDVQCNPVITNRIIRIHVSSEF